jgi:peptidoglycan-associated lipoprotein
MRKLLAITTVGLSALLMFGCSSQPVSDEKAGVEDRTPTATKPAPPSTAQTKPASPGGVSSKPIATPPSSGTGQNPLKDPGNILSKRSIFYDYDSDLIKDEFRPMLQAHAKYLSSNRSARMLIQGNTDERGSREYNIALGQRRAEAVKRMLVLLGAQESQIESASLGEEKPRCEQKTETCYAQNRRGDLLYGGEY